MMKFKIIRPFVCISGMIALLLLQGCDKELESLPGLGTVENRAIVKQVDMDVIVPIHSSSLDYFDYCISYSDNMGEVYRDTVRTALPENDTYWRRTFAYRSLPVLCRCEVLLIPKVSRDSVVSFSFVNPKPYIFSRVIFNSHSYDQSASPEIGGLEVMTFEDIRIDTFMSTYGSYFVSTCSVKEEYGGISCSFY